MIFLYFLVCFRHACFPVSPCRVMICKSHATSGGEIRAHAIHSLVAAMVARPSDPCTRTALGPQAGETSRRCVSVTTLPQTPDLSSHLSIARRYYTAI
jgi:hypothetical protein